MKGVWICGLLALGGCAHQTHLPRTGAAQTVAQSEIVPFPYPPVQESPEDLKTIQSIDGVYQLTIAPNQGFGSGPGDYVMKKSGVVVWQSHLPFFLYDAAVSQKGVAVGYSYPAGRHAMGRNGVPDTLELWLIDPTGKATQLASYPRMMLATDVPPDPEGGKPVLHEDQDLAMLPIVGLGNDFGNLSEKFLLFQLSTGKSEGEWKMQPSTTPQGWMGDEMAGVTGTDLTLYPTSNEYQDVRLQLIDLTGKQVWAKVFKNANRSKEPAFSLDTSLVMSDPRPGHFTVVLNKEKGEFVATKQGETWTVTELPRTPYDPDKVDTDAINAVPLIKAHVVKTVVIQTGQRPAQTTSNGVRNLMIAGPGMLAYEEDFREAPNTLDIVDTNGKLLRKIYLGELHPDKESSLSLWQFGDVVYATDAQYSGNDHTNKTWKVDPVSGALTSVKIPGRDLQPDKEPKFKDGTWVLTNKDGWPEAVTPDGKILWTIPLEKESADFPAIYSPSAMTVDSEDRLLMADVITHNLYIFSRQGKFLKSIDLAKLLNDPGCYPAAIEPDVNGGCLIYNTGLDNDPGRPTIYRMRADGSLLGAFRPHYANGQPLEGYGIVDVDDKGRLWSHDQYAIAELDDKGAVKRMLGEEPKSDVITDIEDLSLTPKGEVYILDSRTHALHAFNSNGTLKYVFQPAPKQVTARDMVMGSKLSVDGNGLAHIFGGDKGEVVVTPDGKFGGYWGEPSGDSSLFGCSEPAADGLRWIASRRLAGIELRDSNGQLVKAISKRPDGGLISVPETMMAAPDGSLCVESYLYTGSVMDMGGPRNISIFGPHGEPESSPKPPKWADQGLVDFDGSHLYMADAKGIACLDLNGKPLWRCLKSDFGDTRPHFGAPQPFAFQEGKVTYFTLDKVP